MKKTSQHTIFMVYSFLKTVVPSYMYECFYMYTLTILLFLHFSSSNVIKTGHIVLMLKMDYTTVKNLLAFHVFSFVVS